MFEDVKLKVKGLDPVTFNAELGLYEVKHTDVNNPHKIIGLGCYKTREAAESVANKYATTGTLLSTDVVDLA